MNADVILLTDQEKQEIRDFTEKAFVLSDVSPSPIATIEDDVILLGLDIAYPKEERSRDTAYFVEMGFNAETQPDMVFGVWREILRISEERWMELEAENK